MSVAPLAGVERQGRGSLGGGGFALGLQNTLSCGLQAVRGTHPLPVLQSLFHQGQGLDVGSALSCQEGSFGACSSSFARVSQPVVWGDEGLRVLVTGYPPFSFLSVVGNRRQLGEVSYGACAADDISWRSSGFTIFQDFT